MLQNIEQYPLEYKIILNNNKIFKLVSKFIVENRLFKRLPVKNEFFTFQHL